MQVYLLHIDRYFSKEEISAWMSSWPKSVKDEVLSYMQVKDFNATFFGKVLLMYTFRQHQFKWDWSLLDYTEKGKPFLKDSNIYFNISHSGDYVLLGISENIIGIDIEKHRPVRIELFNRQFQEEEWKEIHQAKIPLNKFFQFWSIKESAIKADGRGVEILSRTQILTDNIIHIDEETWNYQFFPDLNGYSIAVCHQDPFYFNYKEIQSLTIDILLEQL